MARYGKWRIILGVLFILSTLAFIVLFVLWPNALAGNPRMRGTSGLPSETLPASTVATAASCITSIASFFGLISTSLIAWRRERREASLLEVERAKKEIELAKKRLEFKEIKQTRKKPRKPATPKREKKPKRGRAAGKSKR